MMVLIVVDGVWTRGVTKGWDVVWMYWMNTALSMAMFVVLNAPWIVLSKTVGKLAWTAAMVGAAELP